ncbi:MAG: hypothetical protein B7Z80_08655 [Rhodospirillales bacterium 20-64-7]|nr:MAG: hypothetical protein B7Z80_08655 [Rhodospirillales bacterium 20-64-7]
MFRDGPAPTPIIDFMTTRKISAETAADYGLDQDEAHLALMAAAAGKEVAQRAATSTEDELRRLRDIRRLWDLRLDLHQRLNAAVDLPDPIQTRAEYRSAVSVVAAQNQLRQLEEKLFGTDQVSEKDPGVREAKRLMNGFEKPKPSLAA